VVKFPLRARQVQLIASLVHTRTHGAFLFSGLHGEQVYLISRRYFSETVATSFSSRLTITDPSSKACWGHFSIHLPQALHFSASILM
jgi:hypothetical protein